MPLSDLAQWYDARTPSEQNRFCEAVQRLCAESIIWAGHERDRLLYATLVQWEPWVARYLDVAGWRLRHDETLGVFQLLHHEGMKANRFIFNMATMKVLLVVCMLYYEQTEHRGKRGSLARRRTYPIIRFETITRRYLTIFQKGPTKKELHDAVQTFQRFKLIRWEEGSGTLRADDGEQRVGLLPTIEATFPLERIQSFYQEVLDHQERNDSAALAFEGTDDGIPDVAFEVESREEEDSDDA